MNAERKHIKTFDAYKSVYRLKGARKAKKMLLIMLSQLEEANYDALEFDKSGSLSSLFVFRETSEGMDYWWRVADKIKKRKYQ